MNLGVEIWPDLGFKNDDESGTNGSEDTPHKGNVIERSVENAIDQRGSLARGGVAAGDSRRGKIERDERLIGAQLPDQRNGGSDFAHRDGVQPNAAGFRPRERLGEYAEAFEKMRPVAAIEQARGEVKDDERKCDELDEPV